MQLSIGKNRESKAWRREEWPWDRFVAKCTTENRTWETFDHYLEMDRESQGRIKDVGGFVAAALDGPQRKASAVLWRTAVTLDIDNGGEGCPGWDAFCAAYPGVAAVAYSTHKHTHAASRWRLVVPLAKNVAPDQYEPIARRIAEAVGIDSVDASTYQCERLFYWPSTSKDGEFWSAVQEGEPLQPAEILATYADYRDSEQWPRGANEGAARPRRSAAGACPDPRLKDNAVGAFCRCYSIGEAVARFIPHAYAFSRGRGRYLLGSGGDGVQLFASDGEASRPTRDPNEAVWCVSYHSTDPAGDPVQPALRNAFDLVRIHKFGDLDGGRSGDPASLPSYKAMVELAESDPRVAEDLRQRGLGRIAALASVGSQEEPQAEKGEKPKKSAPKAMAEIPEWMGELETDKRGNPDNTIANALVVLRNDPALKGKIWTDLFAMREMRGAGLPWNAEPGEWTDTDDAQLRLYMENYGLTKREAIADARAIAAADNARDPLKEMVEALPEWDGTPRVAAMLRDYLGAEDSPLTSAMAKTHLVAAIARALKPGCKYDYCLILQGPQGLGKSTFIRLLAGEGWYTDTPVRIGEKDAYETIGKVWHYEFGELAAMSRSDMDDIKVFCSSAEDTFRKPYARNGVTRPRRCVFWGTTNNDSFLKDETGNRRFWVVPVGALKPTKSVFEDLPKERGQLLAEALHLYRRGAPLFLDRETEAAATKRAAEYVDADDHAFGLLQAFLDAPLPDEDLWKSMTDIDRRAYYTNEYRQKNPGMPSSPAEGFRQRKRMCIMEYAREFAGKNHNESSYKYWARKIAKLMDSMPGWRRLPKAVRCGVYGVQKAWERIEEEVKDEDL